MCLNNKSFIVSIEQLINVLGWLDGLSVGQSLQKVERIF